MLYDIGYAIFISNSLHVIPEYTVIFHKFPGFVPEDRGKKSNETLACTFKAIRHHMPEK